jgi:hypothetical protein
MNTFLRADDALLNNESAETLHESTYFYLLPSQFSTSCVLLLLFLCLLAIHFVAETSTEKNFFLGRNMFTGVAWIQMLECYHSSL